MKKNIIKNFLYDLVKVGAFLLFLPIIFAGYILRFYDKMKKTRQKKNTKFYY